MAVRDERILDSPADSTGARRLDQAPRPRASNAARSSAGSRGRDAIGIGLASFVSCAIIAWINADSSVIGSIYPHQYLDLAKFFLGESDREIVTYPMWGYPLVLAATHYREFLSLGLQCLLASGSLALLYFCAAPALRSRRLLAVLCVAGLPWFALASLKAADLWSAGLGVVGVCLLARMLEPASTGRAGSTGRAVAAAAVFGLCLNFRSDFMGFVFGLPLGVALLAPRSLRPNWKHLLLIAVVALLSVVPWGLFRVYHGAPFGITSTNSGVVLVNSLGFTGNKWNIVREDRVRNSELREALGPNVSPFSIEGNEFFQARWRTAVAERPGEFLRKVVKNWSTTLKYGFYGIEVEPYLEGERSLEYEVLKEQLKRMAGSRANDLDIQRFKEQGVWQEDFSLLSVSPALWGIASLQLLTVGLSAVYLLLLGAALVRVAILERTRMNEPILLFCSIGVVYVFSMLGLLQNEPRQANVLYVLGIPLVVDLFDRLSRLRAAPGASTPR